MSDGKVCTVCRREADCELRCRRCECALHYTCALGFDPPDDLKLSDLKRDFMCAPCLVGTSYDLLHRALEAHRRCQPPQITHVADAHVPDDHQRGFTRTAPMKTPKRRARRKQKRRQNPELPTEVVGSGVIDSDGGSRGGMSDSDGDSGNEDVRVVDGTEIVDSGDDDDGGGITPLHSSCITRSKRMTYILNTFRNFPHFVTTLIGGCSVLHGVDGKQLDSEGSVNVRSVGGLCVFALVHALLGHTQVHSRIKQVVWSLGTNDALHQHQHCVKDNRKYIDLLYRESKRIFPQAEIKFVVPYGGMEKVPSGHIKQLTKDIKVMCPDMKVYHPPSLREKLCRDGVHPNKDGRNALIRFLRNHFVPSSRVDRRGGVFADGGDSCVYPSPGRVYQHPAASYAAVARRAIPAQLPRVRQVSGGHSESGLLQTGQRSVPGGNDHVTRHTYQSDPGLERSVTEIAEALSYVMRLRRLEPQQPGY